MSRAAERVCRSHPHCRGGKHRAALVCLVVSTHVHGPGNRAAATLITDKRCVYLHGIREDLDCEALVRCEEGKALNLGRRFRTLVHRKEAFGMSTLVAPSRAAAPSERQRHIGSTRAAGRLAQTASHAFPGWTSRNLALRADRHHTPASCPKRRGCHHHHLHANPEPAHR